MVDEAIQKSSVNKAEALEILQKVGLPCFLACVLAPGTFEGFGCDRNE